MDPNAHYAHAFAQVEAKYLKDFMINPQKAYADHAKYAEGLRKREKEEAEARGKPLSYPHMQISSTNHQHEVEPNTLSFAQEQSRRPPGGGFFQKKK